MVLLLSRWIEIGYCWCSVVMLPINGCTSYSFHVSVKCIHIFQYRSNMMLLLAEWIVNEPKIYINLNRLVHANPLEGLSSSHHTLKHTTLSPPLSLSLSWTYCSLTPWISVHSNFSSWYKNSYMYIYSICCYYYYYL